jgi:hypothetical protein
MIEDKSNGQKPSPEKLAVLRSLPKEILDTLSHDEIRAFLHDDVWPDSLRDKLKDYMVEEH